MENENILAKSCFSNVTQTMLSRRRIIIDTYQEKPVSSTVKTTNVVFYQIIDTDSSHQVERRYSQFDVLRNKLLCETTYKGLLIPQLPEKTGIYSLIYPANQEFLQYRKRRLENFLNKLVELPAFAKDPHVEQFLRGDKVFEEDMWKGLVEGSKKVINNFSVDQVGSRTYAYVSTKMKHILGYNQLPTKITQYYSYLNDYKSLTTKLKELASSAAAVLKQSELDMKEMAGYIKKVDRLEDRINNFEMDLKEAYSALSVYEELSYNREWLERMVGWSQQNRRVYESELDGSIKCLQRCQSTLYKEMDKFLAEAQQHLQKIIAIQLQTF